MHIIYYFPTIAVILLLVYFFCTHLADSTKIRLPFSSKRIKINKTKNKINFSTFSKTNTNKDFDKKKLVTMPKYFFYLQKYYDEEIINELFDENNFSNLQNDDATKLFINNKLVLLKLLNEIHLSQEILTDLNKVQNIQIDYDYNFISDKILKILSNFSLPINILIVFSTNDQTLNQVMFCLHKTNIIKINDDHLYNIICSHIINNKIFIVNDNSLNLYLTNGFFINYKVNKYILSSVLKNNINFFQKYINETDIYNYNNMTFYFFSSSLIKSKN